MPRLTKRNVDGAPSKETPHTSCGAAHSLALAFAPFHLASGFTTRTTVTAAKTKKRPSLFGKPFDGPMEGHEPLIPKQYVHYDLHAWLFKDNPLGMFVPTNPTVSCEGYDFSLLEMPTKVMPGP